MASCGTITVRKAFDASRVSVTSCSGLPSEVSPGAEADLTVEVENNNDVSVDGSVVVEANGSQLGSASFVTAGGGSSTVTVPITLPSQPGEYTPSARTTGVAQGVGGLSVESHGSSAEQGRDRGISSY